MFDIEADLAPSEPPRAAPIAHAVAQRRSPTGHPLVAALVKDLRRDPHTTPKARRRMLSLKRCVDASFGVAGLVALAVAVPIVWLANRRFNKGPLFFTQTRMGRDCRPFTVIKFRTMQHGGRRRGFDDPLEVDRVTPFGGFLRRTHIDEIPQVINVLRGDMSLIGPRPDAWDHAVVYCARIRGYRARCKVRPGLTGLAQAGLGYAEGLTQTRRKVAADLAYMRHMSARLEWRIFWRTAWIMVRDIAQSVAKRPLGTGRSRASGNSLPV